MGFFDWLFGTAQRRKQEEEESRRGREREEAQRIKIAKALFDPATSLVGDALVERLIKAYRTANWGTLFTPRAEQDAAREFIRQAGPSAVDTAIQWLNECKPDNPADEWFSYLDNMNLISAKTKGHDDDYEYLIKLLTEIGDERAVEPLLRHFRADEASSGAPRRKIAEFFARLNSQRGAKGLVVYLDTRYDPTREAAAYGLGLLGLEETRESLLTALDRYGQWVREGLQDAGTEFAKSVVVEWDTKRRATGPPIESMTDTKIVEILGELCRAYMADHEAGVRRLEPVAKDLGEELNRRGGIQEMRRVFSLLGGISGSRTLEMLWSGIGQWRG